MTIRATIRLCQVFAVAGLLGLSACGGPGHKGSTSTESSPAAPPTTSQTAAKEGAKMSAPDADRVEPGAYKFKAVVKGVRIRDLDTEHRIIQGVATIGGERCVFTGRDVNWAIQLDVQEVEKPLWLLKAGEPITFAVHSPIHVFGRDGSEAVGEVWQFSLVITRENDGSLTFGPLTTPSGVFAKDGGFHRPK
jgi:hypothetical protein